MDVDDCQVFRNGPLAIFQSHQTLTLSRYSNKTVIVLSVLLTAVILVAASVFAYVVVTKSRIVPIIRARFENTPYTDFSVEQPPAPSSSEASARPKPTSQTISMVIQNQTTTYMEEGPGT